MILYLVYQGINGAPIGYRTRDSSLPKRCYNQLLLQEHYLFVTIKNGAPKRIRTPIPRFRRPGLYPLSYGCNSIISILTQQKVEVKCYLVTPGMRFLHTYFLISNNVCCNSSFESLSFSVNSLAVSSATGSDWPPIIA